MGAPLLLPADLRLVLGAGAPGVQEMGCLPVEAQRLAPEPGWGEGRAVGGMCVGIPWAQREGCRVQGARRWGHPLRGPGWECKGPVRSPPTPPKKRPQAGPVSGPGTEVLALAVTATRGWAVSWAGRRAPSLRAGTGPRTLCHLALAPVACPAAPGPAGGAGAGPVLWGLPSPVLAFRWVGVGGSLAHRAPPPR